MGFFNLKKTNHPKPTSQESAWGAITVAAKFFVLKLCLQLHWKVYIQTLKKKKLFF